MLVRFPQSRNARLPILVTEFGIVTLVRLLQLSNALSLILVTESGIVTLVRLLHFANTLLQILVTESGIDITLSFPCMQSGFRFSAQQNHPDIPKATLFL